MSGGLHLPETTDRKELYGALLPQVRSLLTGETDAMARMANLAAILHEALKEHWTGFYRVVEDELVLGPFQGPVACSRIARGKGVCGTAWAEDRTIVVPDVDAFPGHIACSALSRSEIVVPVRDEEGRVVAVLDIDSAARNAFGPEDVGGLEECCKLLMTA
jgi:GAF domain-containing protein